MKVNRNVKKAPPMSSKNEILIFILCPTSDDWSSDPSNKSRPKYKKRPPKNEMPGFGLRSTSDDQPSNLSNESRLKCEKGPLKMAVCRISYFVVSEVCAGLGGIVVRGCTLRSLLGSYIHQK